MQTIPKDNKRKLNYYQILHDKQQQQQQKSVFNLKNIFKFC